MAKAKRSEAQEKRLTKLREQDPDLRVTKHLDGGWVLFRYLKKWQRDGWANGVNENATAYTYAMDADGKVYGYTWEPVPVGSGLAELVTYPENHKPRERTTVSTRKPASGKKKASTAAKAVAAPKRKAKVQIEAVALPGAA